MLFMSSRAFPFAIAVSVYVILISGTLVIAGNEKPTTSSISLFSWNIRIPSNVKDRSQTACNNLYQQSTLVSQKSTAFIQIQPSLTRKFVITPSSTTILTRLRQEETIKPALSISNDDDKKVDSSLNRIDKQQLQNNRQRIAIIGSGAVGCYYGSRLYANGLGHDVSFYMRGDNFDAAVNVGLTVTSDVGTNMHIPADKLKAFNNISQMGTYDWIIVSIKSTGLSSIPELIVPLLKHDNTTRVLAIMNGMIENDLISYIKQYTGQVSDGPLACCQTLYGGMAFICCNRVAPANVYHSYYGSLSIGVACTRTGTLSTNIHTTDQRAIEKLFYKHIDTTLVEVDIVFEKCLQKGRWKKMIWNLPFNGLCVAYGGITVDQIVTNTTLRKLAFDIMDETIAAANAELLFLQQESKKLQKLQQQEEKQQQQVQEQEDSDDYNDTEQLVLLGDNEKYAMMKLSDEMGPYKPSTMLDFINRRSMEVQYLFVEPLQRAKNNNVSTPQLQTIVTRIQQLQNEYNLY